MVENIFYIIIFFIIFTYFGYPISLYFIGIFKNKFVNRSFIYPYVTIIIPAHNEEKSIQTKIDNTLSLIYPKEKLQIIIASDGSTDKTNEIVTGNKENGIELLKIQIHGGKENAQKEAIKHSKGEIFVFTDVDTILDPTGVEQIVSNFADPTIGCVSSEDRVIGQDGKLSGEGTYVRYEMWLRRLESKINSLVGLSGSFFAARKEVCHDFSADLDSDFRTVLNSVRIGKRGIHDPASICYYSDILNPSREFDRKVRTVVRGITVFFKNIEFLNVFKYGVFSYQYFCHKLLRWLVPFSLLSLFVFTVILSYNSWLYVFILILQSTIILFVIATRIGLVNYIPKILYIPVYFYTVNTSILVAWFKYFKNERVIIWNPTRR